MVRPYLEISGLVKKYGSKTVLDINKLVVNQGEVLAVIGPNGTGKSTLLRLVACLEKPTAGAIRFTGDNSPVNDLDIRRRLAMIFQEPLLFSGTVFNNIAYGLKVRKESKTEIDKKVMGMADMFEISHLLGELSSNLSGGEAQRVSLARALILKPELLLLDEPMTSLDPPTKESLLADLRRILRELDATVIYVTHERTEAIILADRMAVVDEGRVVQVGEPDEVMSYPANRRIAHFVGVENILKGSAFGSQNGSIKVRVSGGEIRAAKRGNHDGDVLVCIRPENISVVPKGLGHGNGAQNKFAGIIKSMINMGPFYRVTVDCGFPLKAFIAKQSVDDLGFEEGQEVWTMFDGGGVHVITNEEPVAQGFSPDNTHILDQHAESWIADG